MKASIAGSGPRYGTIHDMSPSVPAMNPSTDIVAEYTNVAIGQATSVGVPSVTRTSSAKVVG
jgi:hypothetical protein